MIRWASSSLFAGLCRAHTSIDPWRKRSFRLGVDRLCLGRRPWPDRSSRGWRETTRPSPRRAPAGRCGRGARCNWLATAARILPYRTSPAFEGLPGERGRQLNTESDWQSKAPTPCGGNQARSCKASVWRRAFCVGSGRGAAETSSSPGPHAEARAHAADVREKHLLEAPPRHPGGAPLRPT